MSTYREMIHIVLDELKLASDDAYFTDGHIQFLLGKYRAYLLKKEYGDSSSAFGRAAIAARKYVPETNYQTLCLHLKTVDVVQGMCEYGKIVKSVEQLPNLLNIGVKKIYAENYMVELSNVVFVPQEQMRYVGRDKYRANIIYATIAPDGHLWIKSANPQHLYLKEIRFTAVFEDAEKAAEIDCESDGCDILDNEFPMEESLQAQLIEIVVKSLLQPKMMPEDMANNSKDDSAMTQEQLNQQVARQTQSPDAYA